MKKKKKTQYFYLKHNIRTYHVLLLAWHEERTSLIPPAPNLYYIYVLNPQKTNATKVVKDAFSLV